MRAIFPAVVLVLGGAVAAVAAATDLLAYRPARPAAIPTQALVSVDIRTAGNLSLGRPKWQHAGGLLVGELTLQNGNDYPVSNVIIACDLFAASGRVSDTHRTGIRRVFEPGPSQIDGIEFVRFARDLEGGACRLVAAKRAVAAHELE